MTSSLFFLAAGIRPSSVTAEIVSCAVTSMDFFDRLQEQGEGLFFFFKSNQKGISPYKISTFSSRGLMRRKMEIWNTFYLSTKISQNYKKQIEDSAAY